MGYGGYPVGGDAEVLEVAANARLRTEEQHPRIPHLRIKYNIQINV